MPDATDKTNGKLRYMLSTRVEKSYAEAVARLLIHHGHLQFSKYLRGLIYVDAARRGLPTASLDRPAWIVRAFPELFRALPAAKPDTGKAQSYHGNQRKRKGK